MKSFSTLLTTKRIYRSDEVEAFVKDSEVLELKTYVGKHKDRYINAPAAFDIETSSFYIGSGKDRKKQACMYVWQFGLNGLVMIGRTWPEYVEMIRKLAEMLHLDNNLRLMVYVHNLEFEFQWMRKWFDWKKVFAVGPRTPVYAQDTMGIEYRCSYQLSGYSLANVGRGLHTYHVEKAVGDLDYSMIRHSGTPLTERELGYCVSDVKVVMAYLQEKIEQDGRISKIPLTKTAYVRNLCRNACLYPEGSHKKHSWKTLQYQHYIGAMQILPEEYLLLRRAFMGGFVHANATKEGRILKGVESQDESSAYPAQIVMRKFPISSGKKIEIKTMTEFRHNIDHYACIFDIEIHGIVAREDVPDHPISTSKCWKLSPDYIEDNGRLVEADCIRMTITEVDYTIFSKFYRWESISIGNFYRYIRGYLPTPFVKTVLDLYNKKNVLKGVEGSEQEYALAKENLNSTYGSMVTDIVREEQVYIDDWDDPIVPDLTEALDKYNKDKRRYQSYVWGIYVTAWNRLSILEAIWNIGVEDYIYSDTDSVKYLHPERHEAFFKAYNERVRDRMYRAMDYHRLPRELVEPVTQKGKQKLLGAFDDEGSYDRFKTLGAKRYMSENDGEIHITVSGVSKSAGAAYIEARARKEERDPFDLFDDDLIIPPGQAGKLTHTYIDDTMSGQITDYLGILGDYSELSGIHLEPAGYELNLASKYVDYLIGIRERSK